MISRSQHIGGVVFLGRLKDKIALITGCRRGFGEAMARLFAKEGAMVSICDIVPVDELWEHS